MDNENVIEQVEQVEQEQVKVNDDRIFELSKGLTLKQKKFAEYLAEGYGPRQAYVQAGYSNKGSLELAYEYFNREDIRELVKALQESKRATASWITKEWIVEKLLIFYHSSTNDRTKMAALMNVAKILGYMEDIQPYDIQKYTLAIKQEPLFIVKSFSRTSEDSSVNNIN